MSARQEILTYFSSTSLSKDLKPVEGILIYPSTDNWNDFGHQTYFEFEVLGEKKFGPKKFSLAFIDTKETEHEATFLRNRLKEENSVFVPAFQLPQFFSMQLGMDAYRLLVKEQGVEFAEDILLALNDMVAVRRIQPVPHWVQLAKKKEAFSHSMMRESDSFFAYYNAKSILAGLHAEDLHASPEELKLKFQLTGFSNSHEFAFKFDTKRLIPKRMAVLIGKNGTGKSQALNQLVQSALDASDSFTDHEGGRPKLSRIIAVCTPGETDATFPQVPLESSRQNYLRLSAAPGEISDATDGQTLPEVILQLARTHIGIGSQARWDIFQTAISQVMPYDELCIVPKSYLKNEDTGQPLSQAIYIDQLRRGGGEQRRLDSARNLDLSGQVVRRIANLYVPLSSGQLSFVRLAAQLCLHIENGSLLLIDEPETHLHPNLVSDLVTIINRILELSGSIAIIATHSAYFVKEVPTSQVHVLREENRKIEITQPRLKTFGADVGAISNFVFGDDTASRLVEVLAVRLKENKRGDWRAELRSELSTEAEMYVARRLNELERDGDDE